MSVEFWCNRARRSSLLLKYQSSREIIRRRRLKKLGKRSLPKKCEVSDIFSIGRGGLKKYRAGGGGNKSTRNTTISVDIVLNLDEIISLLNAKL